MSVRSTSVADQVCKYMNSPDLIQTDVIIGEQNRQIAIQWEKTTPYVVHFHQACFSLFSGLQSNIYNFASCTF